MTEARKAQNEINRVTRAYKAHYPSYSAARERFLDGSLPWEEYEPIKKKHCGFLRDLDNLESNMLECVELGI